MRFLKKEVASEEWPRNLDLGTRVGKYRFEKEGGKGTLSMWGHGSKGRERRLRKENVVSMPSAMAG